MSKRVATTTQVLQQPPVNQSAGAIVSSSASNSVIDSDDLDWLEGVDLDVSLDDEFLLEY